MQFAPLLIHLLSAIALATAVPVTLHNSAHGQSNVKGAAYFLTNEPSGNMIMVASLTSDGHVAFKDAVSAGGRGAHATGAPGPDPLMSQGALHTSAAGQFLVAVNAGSNTLSMFSIDSKDPTKLKQVGTPVSSEGEFPISVAINKKATQVCVLNAGLVNGVNCYTVDKSLGLIRQADTLRSLNLKSDPGPMASAAHQIAFNDVNDKLVVTAVGAPGFLAVWNVTPNGTLSENFSTITPPSGGMNPFSLTAVPGTNALVSADTALGMDLWDLSSLSAANVGGNQTASGRSASLAFSGQAANCWSSFSSKTGNFYFIDAGASIITEVNLDKTSMKPSVVKQYLQTSESATIDSDIASLGGKDFLYVLAPNATSIDVLSLDAPGNAKKVGSFNFAAMAKQMKVKINPDNLQGLTTFVPKA
ncbi:hypothetical protein BXZ70DRAFT_766405 [Cristinia sonorae]|uniref:3-carboxymuconate cyclase n=1 Tax=Cristinia sonorae TaxID=1940300 RepID=A0A8K0UTQ2_9AGAR|nr:hypothetical protein BXZ70DRAFT_766405 [Cristinia sonorae]